MTAPDDKQLSPLQRRIKRWSLLYHTIAPLKPAQWLARMRWVIYRQLYSRCRDITRSYYQNKAVRMAGFPVKMLLHKDYLRNLQEYGNKAAILHDADVICRREFTFLNETAIATPGSCWSDPLQSQLWRYHLHYFEYVVTLGAAYSLTDDERYYQLFRELVTDWIEHNPIGIGDGWHPYTISLRCVNWIIAYNLFLPNINNDAAFKEAILTSLAAQLHFLRRHLEFDVGGNHLLENIRALLWGGEFFNNQQWTAVARTLLLQQLDEQILPDGGHYERSPMYHSIVLWDILEMIALARNAGHPLPEQVGECAMQMAGWLSAMLHPDGEIALFNDAIFHEAPSPAQLGSMVAALFPERNVVAGSDVTLKQCLLTDTMPAVGLSQDATHDTSASGYYALGEKGSAQGWLLLDAGEPCPPHLPAHAHCDLLSYEFS
ncbi:MAG: heparinase II/III family protein, partial [bacterium]